MQERVREFYLSKCQYISDSIESEANEDMAPLDSEASGAVFWFNRRRIWVLYWSVGSTTGGVATTWATTASTTAFAGEGIRGISPCPNHVSIAQRSNQTATSTLNSRWRYGLLWQPACQARLHHCFSWHECTSFPTVCRRQLPECILTLGYDFPAMANQCDMMQES